MRVTTLPAHSTFGRALTARDVGGLALSLGVHAPGETIPSHRHTDEYQWCITLGGEFDEQSGAHHERCTVGSLLIRPPDCVHADRFGAREGICLNFFPRSTWLREHDLDELRDTYAHQRSKRFADLGKELALELRQSDSSPASLELLVLELLESAARLTRYRHDGRTAWLAAALDQIEAEPASELRLATLASSAGVSAGHLARAFRTEFGTSAGDYIRERRLQRAADLLRKPKVRLADIAAAVGFYDQAHFSRTFKSRFGVSPAAYRNTLLA